MSKERLEEIKEKHNFGSIDRFVDVKLVNPQELKWLIEQAERVQELETTVDFYQSALRNADRRVQELEEENRQIRQMKYHEAYEQGKFDTNMKVWYEIPELEQQNKRYREALEAIYELAEYDEYDNTLEQIVLEVEKALEGEK